MTDITFQFSGTLIAEPRATQLTTECIREHSPGYEGEKVGRDNTETPYTFLTFQCSEDERVEITARGALAHKCAQEMAVGTAYKIKGRVHSSNGHFRLTASSVKP